MIEIVSLIPKGQRKSKKFLLLVKVNQSQKGGMLYVV
jgi:hypothetical protein